MTLSKPRHSYLLFLQKGSQHRTMAEPTGCVAGGKWIPSKGVQTLMGAIRGPYAPNPALN